VSDHFMNPSSAPIVTDIPVTFAGIALRNPVVLLSGCVGFGHEYPRIAGFSNDLFGAIVLKGTTLEPRLGNKPHRLAETLGGMLNTIGLQNPGARYVVDRILPTLPQGGTRWISNIAGSTVEEYREVAAIFDNSPIDAIELNVSCPNVKEGGAAFGADPEVLGAVVQAVRSATSKPLITKLSPNVTDIGLMARVAVEGGSDGLSVINTLMGMALDWRKRKPILGPGQGGLSGPAIKPVALLKVHQVRQAVGPNVPIMGQGGIASAEDALEFAVAGSTTVGIGTALFYDPLGVARIPQEIQGLLANEGVAWQELIGTLQWPGSKPAASCCR